MLEKLAPTLLAGVPAIVKPATVTSYPHRSGVPRDDRVADSSRRARSSCSAAARAICSIISTCQCAVAFTGSASTGQDAQGVDGRSSRTAFASTWKRTRSTTRCSAPTPRRAAAEFDLFIKEVAREMTTKAGQKCTAIRRTLVPEAMIDGRDVGAQEATRRRSRSATRRSMACAWDRWPAAAQVGEVRKSVDAIATSRGAGLRRRSTTSPSSAPTASAARSSRRCCSTRRIRSDRRSRTTSRRSDR